MNLYLHIGVMKTGTSTIQDFFFVNRELLINKNFLYPISIKNEKILNDHNVFINIMQNNKTKVIKKFQKELFKHNIENVLISAENIQWKLNNIKLIKDMKNFLYDLGFSKVYILIYLRNPLDLYLSMSSQAIKDDHYSDFLFLEPWNNKKALDLCNYKKTLKRYEKIFGKENLIVKIFEKDSFVDNDLLKDFLHTLNIKWDDKFKIPQNSNKSLNILGMEIVKTFNHYNIWKDNCLTRYEDILMFVDKYFAKSDKKSLKLYPPKEIYKLYYNYFLNSNEYVRKHFFPNKKSLFVQKYNEDYVENYNVKSLDKEDFENILHFMVDILSYKNTQISYQRKKEFKIAKSIYDFRMRIKNKLKKIKSIFTLY